MKLVRFVMIGGFLGAGKTTLLGRLARHYQSQGQRVGIITNDQADNLVDTEQFRLQGLAAEEIPGGCFCCRFGALTEAAGRLTLAERPDVLLAEPVGSCTDLVATVVQPLKRLYAGQYQVAPYVVLVDPVRVRRILIGDRFGGFSPRVAYIFSKQLEEADAIAVNKVDMLTPAERTELIALLSDEYPQTEVLLISARTGEGLDELTRFVNQTGQFGRNIPEVDYNVYADGESELGWLNVTVELQAPNPVAADLYLQELAAAIHQCLKQTAAEVAHLKVLLRTRERTATVHLVRGDAVPELAQRIDEAMTAGRLVINARVHTEPATLWSLVAGALSETSRRHGVHAQVGVNQHFKPGRPVPTHRYAEAI
jgi:G3E family GTPase